MASVLVPLPPGRGGREAALEVDASLLANLEAEYRQLTRDGAACVA
jgi:hypothetical protein